MNYAKLNHLLSRTMQEMAYRSKLPIGKPTSVIIILTNRCNARCIHCHSWKLRSGEQELQTEEWVSIFKQLRHWLGPVLITITGGETLLRKDAVYLARLSSQLGFWTDYLTNGFILNRSKVHELVGSGIKRVNISLDGSKPEIHDKVRGKNGFYECVTKAFKMIVEEKAGRTKRLEVRAKTSIMSYNIDDLGNIARWARDNGLDGVEYQPIEPIYYSNQLADKHWYKNNPLWIGDQRQSDKSINELIRMKSEGLPIVNSFESLQMIKMYFRNPEQYGFKMHSHEYKKKSPGCRSWIGGLQIMPDGGLKMCHFMEPFAYSRDGIIKHLWGQRKQCWKQSCSYVKLV